GGTAYWHTNLNVSIPIARWSYPLIPHDWVTTALVSKDDPEHTRYGLPVGERICVDLRGVLRKAVSVSATSLMIAQLARDKLSDEQKRSLALEGRPNLTPEQQAELDAAKNAYKANKASVTAEVMSLFQREILPVTNFIADRANFYAVKPLILVDAGRIILPGA